jgi:hypothetical protein
MFGFKRSKIVHREVANVRHPQTYWLSLMIQPYDLLTALDLHGLMLFFWFTLLFDLPRYILSAIAMACVAANTSRWPLPSGGIMTDTTAPVLNSISLSTTSFGLREQMFGAE